MNEIQPFETLFSRWWDAAKSSEPAALSALRKRAYELFVQMGLPDRKTEEWKYTPLRGWDPASFQPVWEAPKTSLTTEQLDDLVGGSVSDYRLVFVNGYLDNVLSHLPSLADNAYVGSMRAAWSESRWAKFLEEQWGRMLDFRNDNPFSFLNQAMVTDGALVVIPEGVEFEEPVHLVFVATSDSPDAMIQPRNLVVAGGHNKVRLIETYVTPGETNYWTNVTTSFVLGEGALVEHYKVQNEDRKAWHLAQIQIELAASSEFQSGYFGFGGATSRHEIEALLLGENVHCDLNGLTLPETDQRMINRICMEHAMPNCTSNQFYKSILADQGVNVFNGKIYVRQKAQKTDAYQTNQALLLSDDAESYSKPQLEIFADDVKCSHGATSGYLDDDALFFLRSRGISKDDAEHILTYAFARDLVDRVKIEPLQQVLEAQLQERLHYSLGE